MVPQVFDPGDLGKIALLVFLEALLSADNALVLAIIVRHLPAKQQRKALFYGLAGAFVFRLGAILLAATILSLWWVQGIGAAYLIFLAGKHFLSKKAHKPKVVKEATTAGFWMTVLQCELADIAFAIDSVLVAVAIEPRKDKIWVVYMGAIVGVVLLRFAAGVFLKLLNRFPALDHVAYALVGWAGVKLLSLTGHTFEEWYHKAYDRHLAVHLPEMTPLVFWVGVAVILGVGVGYALRHPKAKAPSTDDVVPHP